MKNELSRGDEVYSNDVFQILLEYEVSRSVRYPTPLGILHIEMTPAGLNGHLRSVDIPSGSGRDYKILLPTTNESGLRSVCERLIHVFKSKFNSEDGHSVAFSVNIGAATHAGGESLTRELLLQKADAALKQSKSKGPNTFVINS